MKTACNALVKAALFGLLASPLSQAAQLGPFSFDGSIELEQRLFIDDSTLSEQGNSQSSVRVLSEFFTEWNDGNDRLVIEPFARLDSEDDQRSHTDLRQFLWTHYGDNYEFSAGVGKVFWGVTESLHLVDIINQTDLVENIDTEDKLGQPMLRYSYLSEVGTFEAFILPYFRERTFPGQEGRLNGGILVNQSAAQYLTFETAPFYPQIDQFSTDIQLTTSGWLFKLEAIQRNHSDSQIQDFAAAIGGVEYTIVGLFGSSYDLGLLTEYAWDERGEAGFAFFQNDVFIGARLAFNDVSDSQLLFGYSSDLDNSDSRGLFIEGATRLAPALTLNIEARYFDSDTFTDPLFGLRDDSFIQIGLEYFFN